MAAVTQVSHRHSQGRAYYDMKLAEGKTPKEALRALPAPMGRRGSGVKAGRQAVAAGDAQQP